MSRKKDSRVREKECCSCGDVFMDSGVVRCVINEESGEVVDDQWICNGCLVSSDLKKRRLLNREDK